MSMASDMRHVAARRFDWADQTAFARLTGDVNPMHVDAEFARRTQAGDAVVHGMHVALWALEELARAGALAEPPGAVQVKFLKFVLVGETVALSLDASDPSRRRCVLAVGSRQVMVMTIRDEAPVRSFAPIEAGVVAVGPNPAIETAESLPGRTGRLLPPGPRDETVQALFPALCEVVGPDRVEAMALSSTLVGMVAPGLHSIYSEAGFAFRHTDADRLDVDAGGAGLTFEVTSVDPRFQMVQMRVAGVGLEGRIAAFIRAAPVAAPAFEEAARFVEPGRFAGQRALVVGGSRGIGAATALLLAAGGAEVILTYHRNRAEAETVVAGACARARCLPLDVASPDRALLAGLEATHLYYFATPKIFHQGGDTFDAALFDAFAAVYVKGFHETLSAVAAGGALRTVFYPSSIAVRERPRGMTEYAMAKIAGEELCRDLARHDATLHFVVSRLPRIQTDQTATVPPVPAEPPLAVMAPILLACASRDATGHFPPERTTP
jgi:acyl dehydratase